MVTIQILENGQIFPQTADVVNNPDKKYITCSECENLIPLENNMICNQCGRQWKIFTVADSEKIEHL